MPRRLGCRSRDARPTGPDLECRFIHRSALWRPVRARLAGPRHRPILAATSYAEGSAARRAAEGKRLSIQAWGIVPKVREVDAFLRADSNARERVHEVHPEVCFYFMAGGRPMGFGKKKADGRAERIALLRTHFGTAVDSALADLRHSGCAADDLLDAFAALWTARRIRAGTAVSLPATPPMDAHGLRMEILA